MMIDFEKLKKDHGFSDRAIIQILNCEIKQESCDDCSETYDTELYPCKNCHFDPNLISHFKHKDELDKLFIGAPVMFSTMTPNNWRLTTWKQNSLNNITKGVGYRLPTVKEAPRNVWLAPWNTMPEELKKLRTLIIYSPANLIAESDCGLGLKWNLVTKIMILE